MTEFRFPGSGRPDECINASNIEKTFLHCGNEPIITTRKSTYSKKEDIPRVEEILESFLNY